MHSQNHQYPELCACPYFAGQATNVIAWKKKIASGRGRKKGNYLESLRPQFPMVREQETGFRNQRHRKWGSASVQAAGVLFPVTLFTLSTVNAPTSRSFQNKFLCRFLGDSETCASLPMKTKPRPAFGVCTWDFKNALSCVHWGVQSSYPTVTS